MATADGICRCSNLFYVTKKKLVFLRTIITLLQYEVDKTEDELAKVIRVCDLCGKPLESGELNPHKECVDREQFLADRR